MAVITSTTRKPAKSEYAPSEFDGLWINAGVLVPCEASDTGALLQEPEEGSDKDAKPSYAKFVRMPRGIAVSDLKPRKIYDSMDPSFAAEASVMNSVITEIQNAATNLEEGEAIPINLELQLYRRQEETDVVPDAQTNKSVHKALFG